MRDRRVRLVLLAATLLSVAIFGCTLGGEDTSKLPELQRIASGTPVFPGFKEVNSRHMGKRENAGLTYFYQSSASYEEVKDFYIKALVNKGWSYPTEEAVPKWFVNDGSKALTFKKGQYTIEIEYNAADSNVRYSVDFGWTLPGY